MDLKKYSNTQILQMLGLRFKDYRLMMNLSQGELAKAAGVSVSTVHNGYDHEYERHQPDGPAPAGRPAGPVRRPHSGAARKSISDGPRTSATKGKEEEQWLGI